MNFYYKFNELKVFGIKFKFLQENPVLILNLQNFALISFEFTSFISIRVFVASSLSLEKFDKLSKKRKRKFKKNFGNFIYSYFYFLCIFILPPPIAVSGLLSYITNSSPSTSSSSHILMLNLSVPSLVISPSIVVSMNLYDPSPLIAMGVVVVDYMYLYHHPKQYQYLNLIYLR